MAKIIDYFFTPVSPWTYLGAPRLDAMVRKHGARLAHPTILTPNAPITEG